MIELGLNEIIKNFLSRSCRLHFCGFRPEIVCFIRRTKGGKDYYLLISPEKDHSVWIPPQEGIKFGEKMENAAHRCLEVELGYSEKRLQYRRCCYAGRRLFPKERHGERDLPHSLSNLWRGSKMVGKAYFACLIIVDKAIDPNINRAEIYKWKWVEKDDFLKKLKTGSFLKRSIIEKAWKQLLKT